MTTARLPARLALLAGIDLRSLSLLRIGLGALLLADLGLRAMDLRAHYTDAGILPRSLWSELLPGRPSLHALGGGAAFEAVLFAVAAAAAVALLLGWRTRLATAVSFVLLVSLHHRLPSVLNGGDVMLRLLLFWSLFLPLGARLSLDSLRRPRVGPARTCSVASAALLLQVALVYPLAAAFKRREPVWQELRFLEEAMAVDGIATPFGELLLQVPAALPFLTWAAPQFETFGVLLAFSPFATERLRSLATFLFVGFHGVVLSLTFQIGLFPWVMSVAWLVFLPTRFWEPVRDAAPLPRGRVEVRSAPLAANAAAGACAILVGFHLAASLGASTAKARSADAPERVLRAAGLAQQWSLWSRVAPDMRLVVVAALDDGHCLDLHREGAPLDWEHPRRRPASHRWWKHGLLLATPAGARYREASAAWWERSFEPPGAAEIEAVGLWMAVERPEGGWQRSRLWPEPTSPGAIRALDRCRPVPSLRDFPPPGGSP